jgi:hypothetical protein
MKSLITLKSLRSGKYRPKSDGVRVPIKKYEKYRLSTGFIPIVGGVTSM